MTSLPAPSIVFGDSIKATNSGIPLSGSHPATFSRVILTSEGKVVSPKVSKVIYDSMVNVRPTADQQEPGGYCDRLGSRGSRIGPNVSASDVTGQKFIPVKSLHIINNDLTWASWYFKLLATRLFVDQLVQANIKETKTLRITGPLWWEITDSRVPFY